MRNDRRKLAARRAFPHVVRLEVLAYGSLIEVVVAIGPGAMRSIRVPVREFMFWMD